MRIVVVFAIVIVLVAADSHHKKDEHHKDSKDHTDEKDHKDHKDGKDHKDHDEHHDKRESGKFEQGKIQTGDVQKGKIAESGENGNVDDLKKMEIDRLIPTIIKKLPSKPLSVVFDKNQVQFGNELTPTQVKNPPKVTWQPEKDALYTLTLFDIDAPTKKSGEAINWLVINIPGDEIAKGETVVPFLTHAPEKGSGLHRYVFLLFKQSEKIAKHEPDRAKLVDAKGKGSDFRVGEFVEKHGLGDAVGGNFYKAQSIERKKKRSNY